MNVLRAEPASKVPLSRARISSNTSAWLQCWYKCSDQRYV